MLGEKQQNSSHSNIDIKNKIRGVKWCWTEVQEIISGKCILYTCAYITPTNCKLILIVNLFFVFYENGGKWW